MKKGGWCGGVLLFFLAMTMVLAVSKAESPDKGYYDYQGMIGHQLKIRMSLYFEGQKIVGSYFYEKHHQEMTLQGSIAASKIVLREYDKSGRNTGVFEGYLQTVDSIDGFWSTPGGHRNYPFHLGLIATAVGAVYGKRYQDAGAANDAAVETFATRIQKYLGNNEKRKIAALIRFPTAVKVKGKTVTLRGPEQFIRHYEEIFDPAFRKMLLAIFPRYLFSNYQGIMFGEGIRNIWIGCSQDGCYILKINN